MSWTYDYSNDMTELSQLTELLHLDRGEQAQYARVLERFPMRISPYYLSLADPADPDDPIGRMCIPSLTELQQEGSFDTSGEVQNTRLPGVQHKYRQTVLLLSTNQCAMYCRYCFRKRLVGLTADELNHRVDDAVAYIREHTEVNNVLISGGDALMNPDAILERYLRELTAIPHLDFLRFGSRVPVTLPQRIYEDIELLDLFRTYGKVKPIYVVTHFNHPREITDESRRAVRALQDCGVQFRNQTVLLRGVNDDPQTLGTLLSGLTSFGVNPYYIFQCRPVTGVKGRFQVPLLEGIRITAEARDMQNGFGKSVRYAMSHHRGKIEILGCLTGSSDRNTAVFKFQQARNDTDASTLFTRPLLPTDTWLDDDLNSF